MFYKCSKCYYCLEKLGDLFINCTECNSLKLCFKCFLCGAEGGKHKRTHKYTIQLLNDTLNIFNDTTNWQPIEEIKLLDALEAYGYGNWDEISLHLQSHSAVECKNHYEKFYLNGLIGKTFCDNNFYPSINDHTVDSFVNDYDSDLYKCDLRLEDQKSLGYLPNRDEFEYEYMNNAENILSLLPYNQTVCELDQEFQLALIGIYNNCINQRQFRHGVANKYNLMRYILSDINVTESKSTFTQVKRCIKRGRGRGFANRRLGRGNKHRTSYTPAKLFQSSRSLFIDNCDSLNKDHSDDTSKSIHSKFFGLANQIPKLLTRSWECLTSLKSMSNFGDSAHCNGVSKHLNSELLCPTSKCLMGASDVRPDRSDSGISLNESLSCSSSIILNGSLPLCDSKSGRPRSNSDSFCNNKSSSLLFSSCRISDDLNATSMNNQLASCYNQGDQVLMSKCQLKEMGSDQLLKKINRRGSVHKSPFKRSHRGWNSYKSIIRYPDWLKPFIRFLTPIEAENFVQNLERERILRDELRSRGIEVLDPYAEVAAKSEDLSDQLPQSSSPSPIDKSINSDEYLVEGVKTRSSQNGKCANWKTSANNKNSPVSPLINGLYSKHKRNAKIVCAQRS